jgi:hypothetical protein
MVLLPKMVTLSMRQHPSLYTAEKGESAKKINFDFQAANLGQAPLDN